MEILVDLHTHTIASGHHTTDTVRELALSAKNKGLKYLGITDHTKGMISGAKDSYFNVLKMLSPKSIYGVNMLYSAEVNILNVNGEVDLTTEILKKLDYSIASLHEEVFKPKSESENTRAVLSAMDNKYINIIGHAENSLYPVSFPLICEKAKETNTIIEVNSVSADKEGYRGEQHYLLKSLLRECKNYGCYVSLGSDSHGKENVGDFSKSLNLLKDLSFPQDKIVNYDMNLFFKLVKNKRNEK